MAGVQSHIASFVEAVTAEDYENARTALEQVRAAWESADESAQVKRAIAASRSSTADPGDRVSLTEYAQAHASSRMIRGTFLANAALFLSNPSAMDRGELVTVANSAAEQDEQLAGARSAAESVLSGETVPPSVAVVAATLAEEPVPAGTGSEVEATVANVGDGAASGVTVSFEPTTGANTSPSSVSVGSLAAGAQETVTATVVPQSAGEESVSVAVSADSGRGDGTQLTFDVVEPATQVAAALRGLATVAELVTETTQLPRRTKRPLLAEVEEAADTAQAAVQAAENGDTATAVDRVQSATATIESFRSEFSSLTTGPDRVCGDDADDFIQAVNRQTETAIDRLADAAGEWGA